MCTGWPPLPFLVEFPDAATAVDVNPELSGTGSPDAIALASAIGVLFWHDGRGVNGGVCADVFFSINKMQANTIQARTLAAIL